jgi:hypothetical protein
LQKQEQKKTYSRLQQKLLKEKEGKEKKIKRNKWGGGMVGRGKRRANHCPLGVRGDAGVGTSATDNPESFKFLLVVASHGASQLAHDNFVLSHASVLIHKIQLEV